MGRTFWLLTNRNGLISFISLILSHSCPQTVRFASKSIITTAFRSLLAYLAAVLNDARQAIIPNLASSIIQARCQVVALTGTLLITNQWIL